MQRVAYKLAADNGLSVWSQSKLKMFECPRAGYLRYVERRPEPESEAARFGSLVHSSITHLLRSDMSLAPEEAVEAAARETPGVTMEQMREAADLLARLRIGINPVRLVGAEEEIVRPLSGGRVFYAGLDVLEIDGSQAVITDWKTDRAVRHESEISRDLQVLSYAWAVLDEYPHLEAATVTLLFVRYNQPVSVTFLREEVSDIGAFLDARTRELEGRIADPSAKWPPAPGEACRFCPYSLDCPAVQAGKAGMVIQAQEEARAVAAELAALERRASVLKSALKAYVERNGRVEIPGQAWDFWTRTSYDLRPGALERFLETLAERGKVAAPYIKLNGKLAPALLDDPELAGMIQVKISTWFEAKAAQG